MDPGKGQDTPDRPEVGRSFRFFQPMRHYPSISIASYILYFNYNISIAEPTDKP